MIHTRLCSEISAMVLIIISSDFLFLINKISDFATDCNLIDQLLKKYKRELGIQQDDNNNKYAILL
jgi:hypothetical protein